MTRSEHRIGSSLLLVLTALIWGLCFVAQRSGMEHLGPFFFNGVRELLGALTLLAVLGAGALLRRLRGRPTPRADALLLEGSIVGEVAAPLSGAVPAIEHPKRKTIVYGGIICGCVLFLASNLQQVGMVSTAASKAGFITTLYIVLVPVIGILLKHKTHWNTWVSVAVAVCGLYLLCITEDLTIGAGDAVLLVSALFWALHILAVDRYVPNLNQTQVMQLCIVQFAVAGALSLAAFPLMDGMLVSPTLTWDAFVTALPEIAYAGVLSTGVAFTLAAVGQQYVKPSAASLIMSLEAPFGLLGGVVLLSEALSGREIIGCIAMFVAVILAQVAFKRRKA